MRIHIKNILAVVIGSFLVFIERVHAANGPSIKLPSFPGFSQLPSGSGDNTGFLRFVTNEIIPLFRVVFSAIAVLWIIWYGSLLVFNSGKEASIKESRKAIFYAVIGLMIVNFGYMFNLAFNPLDNSGQLDDGPNSAFNILIGSVVDLMRIFAAIIAVVILIITGYRLAVNAGSDTNSAKYRAQILYTILGLIIINMASSAVHFAISGLVKEGNALLASATNLVLLFLVPIGFVMLVIGGLYMLFSAGNPTQYGKGLKIVKWTAVAMVLIYSSFTIVTEVAKYIKF